MVTKNWHSVWVFRHSVEQYSRLQFLQLYFSTAVMTKHLQYWIGSDAILEMFMVRMKESAVRLEIP